MKVLNLGLIGCSSASSNFLFFWGVLVKSCLYLWELAWVGWGKALLCRVCFLVVQNVGLALLCLLGMGWGGVGLALLSTGLGDKVRFGFVLFLGAVYASGVGVGGLDSNDVGSGFLLVGSAPM